MRWIELAQLDEETLRTIDPVVLNLVVAKGIPALEHIDINRYQQQVDVWAEEFKPWPQKYMRNFGKYQAQSGKGVEHFLLVLLGQYLDKVVGVSYREDQRDNLPIKYTDPNDLFLTGILDNVKMGTCGSMAVLYMAMAWRMGWPVSLAMAGWHKFCHYDDGYRQHNIETTNTGNGGVSMPPDAYYFSTPRYKLLPEHVASGSDLRALKPWEVLGTFFGSRGRHWYDIREANLARRDFALAIELYPKSRIYSHILKEVIEIQRFQGLQAQRKRPSRCAPIWHPLR